MDLADSIPQEMADSKQVLMQRGSADLGVISRDAVITASNDER